MCVCVCVYVCAFGNHTTFLNRENLKQGFIVSSSPYPESSSHFGLCQGTLPIPTPKGVTQNKNRIQNLGIQCDVCAQLSLQELAKQIDDYTTTYEPDDQLEWSLVLGEIRAFIEVDLIVCTGLFFPGVPSCVCVCVCVCDHPCAFVCLQALL